MVKLFHKRPVLSPEDAEVMSIDVLSFIAAEEQRLRQFIAVTGLEPASIRSEANSRDFLVGVLDFILSDDSLLLVFAAHKNIDPNLIKAARHALAPGDNAEF